MQEGSEDAGGPYRDFLTNIGDELMSDFLPLLVRTANNKNNHGKDRHKWTLNPSAKSPIHEEMFQILGNFIGFAARSGSAIDFIQNTVSEAYFVSGETDVIENSSTNLHRYEMTKAFTVEKNDLLKNESYAVRVFKKKSF